MKFLPFENFYIITKLRPDEVQSLLEQEVSPGDGRFFRGPFNVTPSVNTYFEGYAVNGVFDFKRSINYRNSFLPQINGSTEKWIDGSRVHVKMRMMSGIVAFTCIWLGFVILFGIGFVIQETNRGAFQIADLLIPCGMFLFGYVLVTAGFKFESRKAKSKLVELLDGTVEGD